jgi:hypothetical protein
MRYFIRKSPLWSDIRQILGAHHRAFEGTEQGQIAVDARKARSEPAADGGARLKRDALLVSRRTSPRIPCPQVGTDVRVKTKNTLTG